MKTKAIVGLDIVDETGARHFVFQLCAHRHGRFETVALLNVHAGGDGQPVSHFCAVDSFKHSRRAVERLASIYMRRSTPKTFQTTNA